MSLQLTAGVLAEIPTPPRVLSLNTQFLDEAIERLKVENDRLVMESNKLKIRLTAATSDAEHILHHKEADIDRMQTIIDLVRPSSMTC